MYIVFDSEFELLLSEEELELELEFELEFKFKFVFESFNFVNFSELDSVTTTGFWYSESRTWIVNFPSWIIIKKESKKERQTSANKSKFKWHLQEVNM